MSDLHDLSLNSREILPGEMNWKLNSGAVY
jgi:hypothetical protein